MKGALAENASPESRSDPAFPLCCWIILTAAALVSIYAALEYRVLYADGAYYVQRILEEEGFAFIEPSRHYSQLLQKFPTVIAIWLGVDNIPALIICYGLTTYLLPLLLVSLCYFVLPPSRKVFFVFPLVHYLAGTTSASFVGIVEGPVAAAYFWLLLYLLLFRFERKAAMVLTLLALPAVLLHEAMVFLSPLLAAVAVWRARQERHKGGVPLFTLLAMWFMIVAVVQTYFILYPRDPGNRSHFIQDLVHLKWLFTTSAQVNVPALVGLLAMVVFTGVILAGRSLRGTKPAKNQWTLVVGFAMVSLPMVAVAIVSGKFISPGMQFSARNHAAMISFPLALWAIRSSQDPQAPIYPRINRQAISVISILAATVLLWHVVATLRWSAYLLDFRSILAGDRGLVSWTEACESLPDGRRSNFKNMSWAWTNPSLSYLLSPQGRVKTIIANPDRGGAWVPFDPNNPQDLPRSRFFDSGPYRETMETVKKPSRSSGNDREAPWSQDRLCNRGGPSHGKCM